jgi:hypothetical protein
MLYRVIIAAETVGSTGVSTLSIAQILGVSERNNRRDQITSAIMFMDGWCVHGIEGRRADVDRLLRRMSEDRRLRNMRVLVDKPIAARTFAEPMALCDDPRGMMQAVHLADLAEVTDRHAERMVELKQAA